MKITVTNHHCDSRDIPVLGAGRVIKLPAFGSIEIDFASDAQVRAFADILAKKAPAAQMYETVCIRNPVDTVPDAMDTDPASEAEPIVVEPVEPEPVIEAKASPEKTDAPRVKSQKPKKRGRKI
jgi:hypothetical protein